jgi:hypothetical protein
MNKRPYSVLAIAWLYILTGAIGIASHLMNFRLEHPFPYDVLWIISVSLIAVICGVYMLRGSNWARWLAIAWMLFHVILSVFHSRSQLVVHSLLCAVFAYFLFRPQATQYFRAGPPVGE